MEKNRHNPLIRTIYLYLFALAGLIIVIQAGIRALNLGLKTFVFTDIDKQTRMNYEKPVVPYLEGLKDVQDCDSLTEEDRESIKSWIENYEEWKEESEQIDYVSIQRQEEGSGIISSLLIGLPLYLYHWKVIQRETKEDK